MTAFLRFLILIALVFNALWICETVDCERIIVELADSNSKYFGCVTRNGVPVAICTNCVETYTKVESDYDNFLRGHDGNLSCTEKYVDKDKLNIIAHTHQIIKNLWMEAYCSNCFNSDGTATNETATFNKISLDYDTCQFNCGDFCSECKRQYNELNAIYNEIKEKYKYQVCFDLQDKMNRTRGNWTEACGHETPKASLFAFAAANSALTLIPVLFYVGFFVLKRNQERSHEILDQSAEIEPGNQLPTNSQVSSNIPSTSSGITADDIPASTIQTSKILNQNSIKLSDDNCDLLLL